MNLATFSPALAMLFVFALLWILMGVCLDEISKKDRIILALVILGLAEGNHLLRTLLGSAAYGKLLPLTMHLPYFLIFRRLTKCSAIKMIFMILSAVVFTAPTILVNNQVKRLFSGSATGLLLANLISYALILALAWIVFRGGFNHLIRYGDDRTVLRFSLVPLPYYAYMFAVMNVDFSSMDSLGGYIVRLLPTIYVFIFYFLLLRNYKDLNEKHDLEAIQTALSQELEAAETQINLLSEAQTKTAAYRHDLRHHMLVLDGFLSAGKPEQAQEYIKSVQTDVDSISIRRFCENELLNLLCSSFTGKAAQAGITLTCKVKMATSLSISDTELCSLVSNALENALNATLKLPEERRWVEFYCEHTANKLLIEVKNPYDGRIVMRDGLPTTNRTGHGYGCRVIRSITDLHRGLCKFEANSGLFVLRIILPLS